MIVDRMVRGRPYRGDSVISEVHDYSPDIPRDQRTYRPIAVILNDARSPWEQDALRGFLGEHCNLFLPGEVPTVHVFDSEDDFRRLQGRILTHIESYPGFYENIITFGERVSLEVGRMQDANPGRFNLYFVGVTDLESSGVVTDISGRRPNVVGVQRVPPTYMALATTLKALRANPRHVYFPIDSREDQQALYKNNFYKALNAVGYTVTPLQVVPETPVCVQLDNVLSVGDVLCSGFSFGMMQHSEPLISLCNARGVTFAASDLTLVKRGAALGCGNHASQYGVMAGRLLHSVLFDKRLINDIEFVVISDVDEVRVNQNTFHTQTILLSDLELRYLNAVPLYTRLQL